MWYQPQWMDLPHRGWSSWRSNRCIWTGPACEAMESGSSSIVSRNTKNKKTILFDAHAEEICNDQKDFFKVLVLHNMFASCFTALLTEEASQRAVGTNFIHTHIRLSTGLHAIRKTVEQKMCRVHQQWIGNKCKFPCCGTNKCLSLSSVILFHEPWLLCLTSLNSWCINSSNKRWMGFLLCPQTCKILYVASPEHPEHPDRNLQSRCFSL